MKLLSRSTYVHPVRLLPAWYLWKLLAEKLLIKLTFLALGRQDSSNEEGDIDFSPAKRASLPPSLFCKARRVYCAATKKALLTRFPVPSWDSGCLTERLSSLSAKFAVLSCVSRIGSPCHDLSKRPIAGGIALGSFRHPRQNGAGGSKCENCERRIAGRRAVG